MKVVVVIDAVVFVAMVLAASALLISAFVWVRHKFRRKVKS